jgi:hypothetical protein
MAAPTTSVRLSFRRARSGPAWLFAWLVNRAARARKVSPALVEAAPVDLAAPGSSAGLAGGGAVAAETAGRGASGGRDTLGSASVVGAFESSAATTGAECARSGSFGGGGSSVGSTRSTAAGGPDWVRRRFMGGGTVDFATVLSLGERAGGGADARAPPTKALSASIRSSALEKRSVTFGASRRFTSFSSSGET